MSAKGVDTVQRLTKENAVALKSCGVDFVGRYLVSETYDKAITEEEAYTILSCGLGVVLIFEIEAARARKGEEQGRLDGEECKSLAHAMSVPNDVAIYFAVDYDAPKTDYPAIESYLYAAKQSVSPYRCGVYGKADLINSVKADCYMQCFAWSNGVLSNKLNIYQYQWQGGKEAQAIKAKTGVTVDMDRCEDLSAAGVWILKSKTAHEWCVENGLVDDTMRDVSQIEEIIYRYHKMNVG